MKRFWQSTRKVVRDLVLACAAGTLVTAIAAPTALAHARHGEAHRRHHAGGREAQATRGVDVSHFQGAIDWRAVARDHVSFAYIKATEGADTRDSRFVRNWRGARQAGIQVGAYHYFNFCRSGRAQAANFLAATPRASGLPPAVDLEPPSHRCRVSGPAVRRELTTYLAHVERRDGRAVLYVTPGFYRAYHRYLPERPMWRRSIACRPKRGQSWTVWQYRMRGRVHGIHTYVDLNVSHA